MANMPPTGSVVSKSNVERIIKIGARIQEVRAEMAERRAELDKLQSELTSLIGAENAGITPVVASPSPNVAQAANAVEVTGATEPSAKSEVQHERSIREKLLDCLELDGGALTSEELATATGAKIETVRSTLSRWVKPGYIEKPQRGTWKLNKRPEPGQGG